MAGAPGGAGGPGPSVSAGRRAARIWRTATGSATVAITRSRPPQRGHASTSIAKAWRIRLGPGVVSGLRGCRRGGGRVGTVGGQSIAYYGISMAGAVLATLPALAVFLALQRYFVEGIALTGLKG